MKMGTDNINLQNLVSELKKKSVEEKVAIWKRIATDLEKPSRKRRVVNLSRISRNTKENDIIVVPGKCQGEIDCITEKNRR